MALSRYGYFYRADPREYLLTPETQIWGSSLEVGTKRIDIQSAPAIVAGVYGQFCWATLFLDIDENTFDASLVQTVVMTLRDYVFEQGLPVDLAPSITNQNAARIGLICDRAIAS